MRAVLIILCGVIGLAARSAEGRTWRVPDDVATIHAGLDSAAAGDTVLVSCGVYFESSLTMKSGVCLRSESGVSDCVVIDGLGQGSVIECVDVDTTARLEGLTLTGGGSC